MRGLTEAERREMRALADPNEDSPASDDEERVLDGLVERGCATYHATPDHPTRDGYWRATPAGLVALACDRALRAMATP